MHREVLDKNRFIAIYCRVSTEDQAREGISLEEQQERLKAYCKAMGWFDQYHLFVDDGYSAKSIERPQLKLLMDLVNRGEISKILVTKLDRMSRKLKDLLTLIDIFQEHEVSFVSISESFDTNTPSGRLTLQVLGAVAEFERERIRERVLDNMFHAANKGKWLTQYPYGYRLVDKELAVYEPEASVVRRVFDLYANQGWGFYAIAKQFNEEGIVSRKIKEWSIRAIKILLSNPVYKGTFVWNRMDSSKKKRKLRDDAEWITIEDCLPHIVEKPLWEKVQVKMGKPSIAPRAQTSPHLLGGLLKCGDCGSGMSIGWSGSPKRRYRVYRCSANKNKGTCTSRQFKADDVESWLIHGLSSLSQSLNIDLVPKLLEKVIKQQSSQIDQRLAGAKSRYKRKVEAYTAGLIELSDLSEEKERLEKAILDNQIDDREPDIVDVEQLKTAILSQIKTVVDAISLLPVIDAKALLRLLVSKVTILGDKELDIDLDIN